MRALYSRPSRVAKRPYLANDLRGGGVVPNTTSMANNVTILLLGSARICQS
jgi:hypothetical protein